MGMEMGWPEVQAGREVRCLCETHRCLTLSPPNGGACRLLLPRKFPRASRSGLENLYGLLGLIARLTRCAVSGLRHCVDLDTWA